MMDGTPDTLVTLAKRRDWKFQLSPARFAMPIRLDTPMKRYATTRAEADALIDAEDRYEADRRLAVHKLRHVAGTLLVNVAWTQIVNVEPAGAPRETPMPQSLHDKLRAIVDDAKRSMRTKTADELIVLASLDIVDEISDDGLSSIVATNRAGAHILVGWPSWSVPQIAADLLVSQAITFVRSVAQDR